MFAGKMVSEFEGQRVGESGESRQSDQKYRSVNTVWPLLQVPMNPKKISLQKPGKIRDQAVPTVKSVLPLNLVPKRQFSTVISFYI